MKDLKDLWWNPLQSNEELANFVVRSQQDNNLDELYLRAQERLKERRPDLAAFCGYNADPQGVIAQIEAIYNAFASLGIGMTPRAADLPQLEEQYVRSAGTVIEQREANCIDASVILSALLLRAGLNPIILLISKTGSSHPSHSILGCWLEDRKQDSVWSRWADVRGRLGRMILLEPLGALDGECRLSFLDSVAEAKWSLPLADRSTEGSAPHFSNRMDKQVFCLLDIKAAMIQPAPIIAIMGAKGGVGKTTLSCRMAELIAEKGNDVMLVDLDVESAGSSTLHRRRARRGAGPGVATVYDHLKHLQQAIRADVRETGVHTRHTHYSDDATTNEDPALEPLEDVTPSYLDRRGLGRIYLLPARSFGGVADRWESVANLPADTRNELLLGELQRMMDRGNRAPLQRGVDCIIFDCGAEFNPLVSAAFHLADYGFVVANPDPICQENINDFDRAHKRRFRGFDENKIRIIVNRVQSEDQRTMWEANARLAGVVPDDPELQRDWFVGEIYFDLGYGGVSRSLVSVLERSLRQEHRSRLVPDEISTWVAPWWNLIKERELPARILDPKKDPLFKLGQDFRRATWTGRIGVLVSILFIIGSAYSLWNSPVINDIDAKFAAVSFNSAEEGRAALVRIQGGQDLFALAAERRLDPFIGSPEQMPELASLDAFKNCMKATSSGSVCPETVAQNNKNYVIKVLQKASVDEGTSKARWLTVTQKVLSLLSLIASIVALGRFLLLAWVQHRKTNLLRRLQKSQATSDLVEALDTTVEKGKEIEVPWEIRATRALDDAIVDRRQRYRLFGDLAKERPLIAFVIKRKEMARWLHDLLEADRLEQRMRAGK